MSGMPGLSGRKAFVPTPEQRSKVKVLAGLGVPQEQICRLLTDPQTGKSLAVKTLRRCFPRELETARIELRALIGNFTVATILGIAPPAGTRAIDNPHARASLLKFYAQTQMGWTAPMVNRHNDHVGDPIEYQGGTSAREFIRDRIERLSRCHRQARETEGSSSCPSGEESDAT